MCNDFSCDNLGGIYFSIVFLSLVLCCFYLIWHNWDPARLSEHAHTHTQEV